MMLDYDWGNPAAAAVAMMLFGEDMQCQNTSTHNRQQAFDPYGDELSMDFFQTRSQPISAAVLFSNSMTGPCNQRYGLSLPPVPIQARIGLNLGVRTYFSSGPAEEEMMVGRVCRRRTRTASCQAEGCGADLTHAKRYHHRHKVCEFHSKASIVIAAGLSQRFCQQCSRFHLLSEFDQGKRSCRKRLADHNRRRRKSQDLTTSSAIINSHNTTTTSSTSNANNIINDNPTNPAEKTKPETFSSVTHVSSPQTHPMVLGLSASSTTETSSFLSHLGEFRGQDHRLPMWDVTEEGGIYQNKSSSS